MSEPILKYLQSEFLKRTKKNEKYSIRAFARDLGIEHSALSKILAQKRPLTFEIANRLLTKMKVPTATKNTLILSLADPKNFAAPSADHQFVTLDEKELAQTFRWHFYAILCALEIPSLKPHAEAIAKFLNLDLETTNSAIEILIKMGAIKRKKSELLLTGTKYTTTNRVKSDSLVKAHEDHIHEALKILKQESHKDSDITGTTIAIPLEKLDEASRRIKEFRRGLAAWLSDDSSVKTDVYRLNIQLFPLGKIPK